ncbi:hydroxymethylbilane synthase [Rubrobacter indicoceani]|uniref:hydroxymethylbilane synthase n=1 Tax=Rubrobacter indicoceani TaxID=2051957 RepID=UPI000E5BB526|nr:hydroxymethylbilane synthase [Rubrobacter indicoceani]
MTRTERPKVILGTRGSKLALAQSENIADRLRKAGIPVEIQTIKTTAEQRPDESFAQIDQRDLFTKQIDDALLSGGIDLAVHSLKDIPTDVPDGTEIVAVPERHEPSDALVSQQRYDVDGLPDGAVVATSSLRRRAQLLAYRPDLKIADIRGNVDTRVRKVLEDGHADAAVLAGAGLSRIGHSAPRTEIPHNILLPAVGQGALAVTIQTGHELGDRVRSILNDPEAEWAVLAERAMLSELEGGCRVPVGGYAVVDGAGIHLRGRVVSVDGAMSFKAEGRGDEPEALGVSVARDLLEQGAEIILSEVRQARSGA